MSGDRSRGTSDMEGNGDSIAGCRGLMLSPKEQFPGFMSDPCFSKPSGGASMLSSNGEDDDRNSMPNSVNKMELENVVKSGGSIAERRAKFGFDVSKISTSTFKSNSSSDSQAAESRYLLRTPGISSSALLESPMMLPNLQPSPTTGAFALPQLGSDIGMINTASSIAYKNKDSDATSSFTFNPHCRPVSLPRYPEMQNQRPHKSLAPSSEVEVEFQHPAVTHPQRNAGFEFPTQLQAEANVDSYEPDTLPDFNISNDMAVKVNSTDCQLKDSHAAAAAAVDLQQIECHEGEDTGKEYSDGDQKVMDPSGGAISTSVDGYSWRKYGQKQVKGSEFPRSYYKCTQPSCPVKKKVEHSHDGQITEIVYKGAHNHPELQPNRRSTFSSSVSCGEPLRIGEGGGSVQGEGGTVLRPDGLEMPCLTYIATRVSDASPANQGTPVGALESAGTPELSATLANNEEEDDTATQGSMLIADENDNEPVLKKQRIEEPLIEAALASRAIREPRVIVQIESEVDILDDGYRWRKYGQKVVKGNPNPRSYYKCTHPGCSVRKHVERASHNLKCVLTTYEGKHNHEVPTARNSSHTSSAGGNSAPSLSNPQGLLTLPQNRHLPKSERQDMAHASRNQDFLGPNFLGNFAGGAASVYQLKFPTLPNAMHYGAFHTTAPMVPTNPGLSIPPPMGFSPSSNLDIPHDSQGRPVGMPHSFFSGQPPKEGDVKLIRPMQD